MARKLDAQSEFIFWWDTQAEKDKGGGDTSTGKRTRNRPVTGALKAGKNSLPDRMTLLRWRRKLNTPEAFELT